MTDQAVHRLYRHFKELPSTMRTLFTGALCVVGLGYLFALLAIFFVLRVQTSSTPLSLIIMLSIPLTVMGIMPGFCPPRASSR